MFRDKTSHLGTTTGLSKVLVALIKDSWGKQGVCLSDGTVWPCWLGLGQDGLNYLWRGTLGIPGGWRMGWRTEAWWRQVTCWVSFAASRPERRLWGRWVLGVDCLYNLWMAPPAFLAIQAIRISVLYICLYSLWEHLASLQISFIPYLLKDLLGKFLSQALDIQLCKIPSHFKHIFVF